jgi:hypothetical protein
MPDRTLFVHVQREFLPPKWKESSVMTKRWRLLDGRELYDITADPGQQNNIAAGNPDIVQRLRTDYETWWTSLEPAMKHTVRYVLGGAENPTTLSSHDWLMPGVEPSAWHRKHIQRGDLINGPWAVEVKQAGTYEITLHRWPPYLKQPMEVTGARLRIGAIDESQSIGKDATGASFRVQLETGPTMLQTWLTRPDGKQHGAYYTRVRLMAE